MKTISYVAGFLLYVTSLNVSAIPITTIDGVDNMVIWDELIPGSDFTEAKIFADYLSVDVSTLTLSKNASSRMGWMEVDGDALREDLWAFDFPGLDPFLYIDIYSIGHVSTVPEPDIVGLIAIGLLGMVVVRHRLKA